MDNRSDKLSDPVQSSSSLDLTSINADLVRSSSTSPDAQSKEESDGYTRAMEAAKLQSFTQDTAERKKYAQRIFWLVAIWITAILVILLLAGFGAGGLFLLSEKVLLAAIGSTTVNILGVFFIVVRYLFSREK